MLTYNYSLPKSFIYCDIIIHYRNLNTFLAVIHLHLGNLCFEFRIVLVFTAKVDLCPIFFD